MKHYYNPQLVHKKGRRINLMDDFEATREQLLEDEVMCVIKRVEGGSMVAFAIYNQDDFQWTQRGFFLGLYAIELSFVSGPLF